MSVQCGTIIKKLEEMAPTSLAEGWDNVGLQVGDPEQMIAKVMVALTASPQVVAAAAQQGVDLLVTHHPLIFKPMKRVVTDEATGQVVTTLIRTGISVYAAHTNLDIVSGGVNDVLAQALGLDEVGILVQIRAEKHYKLVVYVPLGHEDALRQALCEAGAGQIGNYEGCSFGARGVGTFRANPGATPFLGTVGELVQADEIRLETVVPAPALHRVLKAMVAAHPYEEVAYDLFCLDSCGVPQGIGRLGILPEATTLEKFLDLVSERLGQRHLSYTGDLEKTVKTVAICGGSGASYLGEAKNRGADVYLTGDVKYHDGQSANELGLALIDGGHFATERLIVPVLAAYLAQAFGQDGVTVVPYLEETDFLAVYEQSERKVAGYEKN